MTQTELSRRQFFKYLALAGAAVSLGNIRSLAAVSRKPAENTVPDFNYQYRSFSVDHLQEVREWFEQLKTGHRLSSNKTFLGYIGGFCIDKRAYLPNAKSVIVFSVPQNLQSITFNHQGAKYIVRIPTGYTSTGLTGAMLRARIRKDIIIDPSKKLKGRVRMPLKTLSVHSGLAEYGRNNITYVEGYGSYHALYGLFTDKELDDNWGPLKMHRLCKGCSVCRRECPTMCIPDSGFIINAGRCLSLYNELPDPIPAWIKPAAHNALVGCLKCQFDCPINADLNCKIGSIAELTEEETDFILRQGKDEQYLKKIVAKLGPFTSAQDLAYFSRNLNLVLPNVTPVQVCCSQNTAR